MRSLHNRDCSTIEAADTCLQLPPFKTDRKTVIKWVDVFMIRNRKVRPLDELKKLADDSEEIFYESFVDEIYPNRPKELEECTLYELAKWYQVNKEPPKSKNATFFEITISNTHNPEKKKLNT